MRMTNETKEGLKDLLRYNDSMMEQKEYLQHQEESWREYELIRKSQEERKKQSEMDACMNNEQQVPEYQQAVKSVMEQAKEQGRVHMAHKYIEILSDSFSSFPPDDSSETFAG